MESEVREQEDGLLLRLYFHAIQFAIYPDGKRNGQKKRQYVGYRLGHLHAMQPIEAWKDDDGRNEKQTLSANAEQCGAKRHAYVLEKHVGCCAEAHQRKSKTLPPQDASANLYHHGVLVAKECDDLWRKDDSAERKEEQNQSGTSQCETIGLSHSSVFPSAVVEAAHRLKPLVEP